MIVQVTTVHPRGDIRIAVKQSATLAAAYPGSVQLVVADGQGPERRNGVKVVDLGRISSSRLFRPFQGCWRVVRYLWSDRPRVLHFHDPELIPAGIVAKALGARVIYDVHENVPKQISGRDSMNWLLRTVFANGARFAEWLASMVFDAVVCATPNIARRFPAKKTVLVQNFPILAELQTRADIPYIRRPNRFIYLGVLTAARGAQEMVEALQYTRTDPVSELKIAGVCRPDTLQDELRRKSTGGRVEFLGWMDRDGVAKLLGTARAGLVLFHDAPNHVDAQPNKLFEYMSAGLPVIASDFPLWRQLVDEAGCGILVDPSDSKAIARAMEWLTDHPEEAEEMGNNGKKAVESRFRWEYEAESLLALYEKLLDIQLTA
jgi:glycosyltransferase involved in cell wall biosynthesis